MKTIIYKIIKKCTAIGVGKYENNKKKKKIGSPRVYNKYVATR